LLLTIGVAGVGVIDTVVVASELVHPLTVTVTEYVPSAAIVTPAIDGFCKADEKLLGPVHE
jgi:hypothetical protein